MANPTANSIIEKLQDSLQFRIADAELSMVTKISDKMKVFHIMTKQKFLLSHSHDGGIASEHFALNHHGPGQMRHAVICRVEIKGSKITLHPSPSQETRFMTKDILEILAGAKLGEEIPNTLDCWQKNPQPE